MTPWVKCWAPRPEARRRLFCFPFAGASAAVFRPWARSFPAEIEVCAVEYPGRGTRPDEELATDIGVLASRFGEELPGALLDKPFAVFGYSLGALVAYEWLRHQTGARQAPLLHLFVCARRAPHMPARLAPLHPLAEGDFVAAVQSRFAAIPDVLLGEPELLELFLAPLRADLRAVESYQHQEGPILGCSLSAFGGKADPDVSEEELAAWSAHTRGAFSLHRLDAGHFFLDAPLLRSAVLGPIEAGASPGGDASEPRPVLWRTPDD